MVSYVWEVAVEALTEAKRPLHYERITEHILNAGRTHLGSRGRTPAKSVGTILRSKPEIFIGLGDGYYDLRYRPLKVRFVVQPARRLEACSHLLDALRQFVQLKRWDKETVVSSDGDRCEVEVLATVDAEQWRRNEWRIRTDLRHEFESVELSLE